MTYQSLGEKPAATTTIKIRWIVQTGDHSTYFWTVPPQRDSNPSNPAQCITSAHLDNRCMCPDVASPVPMSETCEGISSPLNLTGVGDWTCGSDRRAHLSICCGAGALWVSTISQLRPVIHMLTSSSLKAAKSQTKREKRFLTVIIVFLDKLSKTGMI